MNNHLWRLTSTCFLVATLQAGAETVFQADFNASSIVGAGQITESNLNLGTDGGTWSIQTAASSLIGPESSDATNKALALDRTSYDLDLILDQALPFNIGGLVLSFDSQIIRTSSSENAKKNRIYGYDSSNNEVFQIILTTDGTGGAGDPQGRLRYVDASGNEVTLANDVESVGSSSTTFVLADMTSVSIRFGLSSMDILVNNLEVASDVAFRTIGVNQLAYLSFEGAGSSSSDAGGAWIDNITIDAAVGNSDSDNDGLNDIWEFAHFGDLDQTATGNPDGDGLDNVAEEANNTDPNNFDTDNDGLEDGVEVAGLTSPINPDTDDDGLLDGVESNSGFYLSSSDTGTNPISRDSDGDGYDDGIEIRLGYDPQNVSELPDLPNIVFIMVDDLDTREVGVYGQATLQTPEIDTMAGEGMLFTDFYAPTPVCHSTRSCLMSGADSRRSQDRYNGEAGGGYQIPLAVSRVTIAEVLKQAGYTTGCVGKWGMGGPGTEGTPWEQGFDFFFGYLGQVQAHKFFPKHLWKNDQKVYLNQELADAEGGTLYIPGANNPNSVTNGWSSNFGNVCSHDLAVKEGLDFIDANANSNRPFFLYCAWTPPHTERYPAASLAALTDADGLLYDPTDLDQTLINELYPGAPFGGTAELPNYHPHTYASMVSSVDRDTGRVIDKLVELGIDDNTLVIFCSDNGQDYATFLTAAHLKPGYSDLRGNKRQLYEGGIRSPFVARWPGKIPAGSTSDVIGTFVDLLPTFADMAGVQTPSEITGRSILPALLGGNEDDLQARDYHYWYYSQDPRRYRAVRQGDWKLHRSRDTNGGPPTYELFNLSTDPYETTNLVSTETAIFDRLQPLVEGTHEVTRAHYFKTDDEFFTMTNLTTAAYELDGENGYTLIPNGSGSSFNFLPFETGVNNPITFRWKFEFPSSNAASFLVGVTNDVTQCLAVRIDAETNELKVSYLSSVLGTATISASDFINGLADCSLTIDPKTGVGTVNVGSTQLGFDNLTGIGSLKFWGFEVENNDINVTRPFWSVDEEPRLGGLSTEDPFEYSYLLPGTSSNTVTMQYSTDLIEWIDNPPGVTDLRSTNSQGNIEGRWSLRPDSLLPRLHDKVFFRASSSE